MARGDNAIDAWTTHCPECGREVAVPAGTEAVACPQCDAAFAPEGLTTQAWKRPAKGNPPRDPSDELVGRTLGGWRLVRLIGRGGMGRVYEAEGGEKGQRRVALKVLSSDLASDPSFVRRFHREARVLSELSHPHVVEVLEQGEEDGRLFFAMEYVRGENLRRKIERGPMDPQEAVRVTGEIASALAYAHSRGVIHRDLKPENVLLDEAGRVHLADFGLSRLVAGQGPEASTYLTRTDVILGTYEYMAPEQRRGEKDLDARVDVYALGVLLYEMLTGQLPLGRFAPPSHSRSTVPASLDEIVNRALAPERGARYASAADMKQAVESAWAARGRRRKGRRREAPPARSASPKTVTLSEEEVAELRPFLRHVDITALLDRVAGVFLILSAIGIVGRSELRDIFWLQPFASFFLFVGGIMLLEQGGRMARMTGNARSRQVVWSALLLFLVPPGTVFGLYGLIVFTSDRARQAFRVGRKGLEGPRPVVAQKVVEVQRSPPRKGPWVPLQLLMLAALLWSVYVVFVLLSTDVATGSLGETLSSMSDTRMYALKVSVAGLVASIAATVLAFRARRVRRGFATALTALLLFGGCTFFLSGLHSIDSLVGARPDRAPPPYRVSTAPVPAPRLEIRR